MQIGDDDKKQQQGREKTRLTKGTGQSIKEGSGRIGGPFTVSENPAFLAERLKTFETLAGKRKAELEGALCFEDVWMDRFVVRDLHSLLIKSTPQPSRRSPSRSRCLTAR